MFSKILHDTLLLLPRHFADFDSVVCACERGSYSADQNMALTSLRTFASAVRSLSLQHRLHGKNVAVVTARGVHFSYVPESPDQKYGKDAVCV